MPKFRPKKEISHRILDAKKNQDKISARYRKIGSKERQYILKDKVIYPINVCPHCKSKATFHRRVQENNDAVCNVFDSKQVMSPDWSGFYTVKFDFCLDCHRKFIIEIYIYERVKPKKPKKKQGFWDKLWKR